MDTLQAAVIGLKVLVIIAGVCYAVYHLANGST
jgi:hypothetical protein